MRRPLPRLPQPRSQYLPFRGGYDTETPRWDVDPSKVREAQNYEIGVNGGYQDVVGYERYDGHDSPSDATYAIFDVTISGSVQVGDTIAQQNTGATAVVLAVVETEDPDYLVITKIDGTFNDTDDLQVGAFVQASPVNTPMISGASTPALNAQYLNLAADEYRNDISAVPGSGPILGVERLNDILYAFRNNAGGTAANLYKSSASGWTHVSLGRELEFTSGGVEAATGSVELTGGASGSVDGITVDGVEIMSGAVNFDSDLATTATAVAANINTHTSSPNYTADASGAVITITAETEGTGPNGFVVASSTTTITTSDTNMSGGVSNDPIEEGDIITGAMSGATATVTRVALESGDWTTGDAAGRLIFASQTGTFQAENLNVGANTNVATIAGDSGDIVLGPDGSFEFDIANFGGLAGTDRIYGCDGVNRGFEFDGSVFVPINTGMDDDRPTHVAVHKNHLFFSFAGSAQHSGIGTPYIWSPIFGAAELATGDTITGFQVEPGVQGGATLGIYNRNRISVLYGNSSADWNLVKFRKEVGAYARSIQQFGFTVFLDDRGLTNLQTTQAFGNFITATLSSDIQRYVNEKRSTVTASCIVRDKSQYRLFFNDGSALFVTTANSKLLGIMPQLLGHRVECITSRENNVGNEEIFFGSDNGYVYQMERGTSFDGDEIEAYLVFHYNFLGSLRVLKRFTEVTLETEGEGYAEFNLSYELGYTDDSIPQPLATNVELNYSPVFWDEFTWDNFTWDGQTLSPSVQKISGDAENIALVIRKNSDRFAPIRFSGANFFYHIRRRMRS